MIGTLHDRREELEGNYKIWEPATLSEVFDKAADKFPDNYLIFDEENKYTYGQVKSKIDMLAAGLIDSGIRAQMKIAVLLDNCAEFVLLTFALAKIGAVKTPVNVKLHADELERILSHLEADYIITRDDIADQKGSLFAGAEDRNILRIWKCLKQNERLDFRPAAVWDEFFSKETSDFSLGTYENKDPNSIADICYTTGTMSSPKGVILSHDMLLRSAYANCLNRGFEKGRRIMVPLPLFHVYGYVEGLISALFVGGGIIISKKYSLDNTLMLMEKYKANDILAVPVIMIGILNHSDLDFIDLSSLHAVYCSASKCPDWVWGGITDKLHITDIITGYGMTEVAGASMQTDPSDAPEILKKKVGRVLNGGISGVESLQNKQIECKIVDDRGLASLPGNVGELWCRGSTVTRGYYNNEIMTKEHITSDGWFKTGDLGCFDKAGYFEFHGRVNDMYKFNGENVLTPYVEEVLKEHKDVLMAAVIGVPDEKHGEIGVACIVPKNNTCCSEKEMKEFCKERLAEFQIPKYFVIMDKKKWPITETGKVRKNVIKKLVSEELGVVING